MPHTWPAAILFDFDGVIVNSEPLHFQAFHEVLKAERIDLTEDEYFVTEDGAKAGITFENESTTEPLVILRYFGPDASPNAPALNYTGNVKL